MKKVRELWLINLLTLEKGGKFSICNYIYNDHNATNYQTSTSVD